jgi:TPR repeat protein
VHDDQSAESEDESLRGAAQAGDVEAMVRLAWLLESFPHCEEDQVEAVAWSRRAAEHGHPVAMHDYGVTLETANEVEPWLRRSAEAGYWPAMYNLAALLLDRGGPTSRAEAVRWLRQSAHAGDPLAEMRLAELATDADSHSIDGPVEQP